MYYDTSNFENTLGNFRDFKENESVQPKKSQQVQFKLEETQLSPQQPNPKASLFSELQTKQLVTPKYDLGRTASNTFNIKADQYSTPYTPYCSKIDSPSILKPSQGQAINNNLGINNLVVPKTNKKMDPLTPKFTGSIERRC